MKKYFPKIIHYIEGIERAPELRLKQDSIAREQYGLPAMPTSPQVVTDLSEHI